jgi:phosphoribosylformimino-5-aminoimidazole carboxamide ribotide isomerase
MTCSVIAAMDILDGRIVRLKQGNFAHVITYDKSIQDCASIFLDLGIKTVQLIDVNAAKTGKLNALSTIRELSSYGMHIHYGGGIRSLADAKVCLDAGAHRVITGTAAIKNPAFLHELITTCGTDKVILALDIYDYKVAIIGWTDSSDLTLENALAFAQANSVRHILMTDINRDGMQQGVNAEFYGDLANQYPQINIIAAGGVTTPHDIQQLKQHNINQIVVGRALYEDALFRGWIKDNLKDDL